MYNYYLSEAARFKERFRNIKKSHALVIFIFGALIIPFCSLLHIVPPPPQREYYYSKFLFNNLTLPANLVFALAGFSAGYYTALHPLLIGVLLYFVLPVIILMEGTFYRGSHNLLPFELIYIFILSLPSAIAAFFGRLFYRRNMKSNRVQ